MSDRAFRPRVPVKRVPRIPRSADTFTLPFVHSHDRVKPPGPSVQVNHRPRAWTAVREVCPLYPRGPWLRPELCCLQPSSRTTTPSASLAGTRRLRLVRLYAAPSLCGHAEATHETFPTFPAALSTRAVDHTPVGPGRLPVAWPPDTRLPQLHNESPPTVARLCQPSLTRRSLSTLHRSLYATARVFASPSWLATTRLPTPPEDFVTLAFAGQVSPPVNTAEELIRSNA